MLRWFGFVLWCRLRKKFWTSLACRPQVHTCALMHFVMISSEGFIFLRLNNISFSISRKGWEEGAKYCCILFKKVPAAYWKKYQFQWNLTSAIFEDRSCWPGGITVAHMKNFCLFDFVWRFGSLTIILPSWPLFMTCIYKIELN